MRLRLFVTVLSLFFAFATASAAPQDSARPELGTQVDQLRSELTATQGQLTQAQQQIQELRAEVEQMKALLKGGAQPQAGSAETFPTLQNAITESKPESTPSEDQQVLAARVEELEQTKVETASKYKVKLSGMLLMNTYMNSGDVDISDLPNLAFPHTPNTPHGDLGATMRQSMIGLEMMGPKLAGATTGASVLADFFGGFPDSNYGET